MRDYVTCAKPSNRLDLKNKSPVTAEQPLDSVSFGAVVGNTEFVAPHALLSYARVIVDLSQITKNEKHVNSLGLRKLRISPRILPVLSFH
jgi:hypothetical protein